MGNTASSVPEVVAKKEEVKKEEVKKEEVGEETKEVKVGEDSPTDRSNIEFLMLQTEVDYDKAKKALKENPGDVVDALMQLMYKTEVKEEMKEEVKKEVKAPNTDIRENSPVDQSSIDESNIIFLMLQTEVDYDKAKKALKENPGDVVNALFQLMYQ